MLLHTHTHTQSIYTGAACECCPNAHALTRTRTHTHTRPHIHTLIQFIHVRDCCPNTPALTHARTYPPHPYAHTRTHIQFIHVRFARHGYRCVHTNTHFIFHFFSLSLSNSHQTTSNSTEVPQHLHQHTIYVAHSCIRTPPPKTEVLLPNAPPDELAPKAACPPNALGAGAPKPPVPPPCQCLRALWTAGVLYTRTSRSPPI